MVSPGFLPGSHIRLYQADTGDRPLRSVYQAERLYQVDIECMRYSLIIDRYIRLIPHEWRGSYGPDHVTGYSYGSPRSIGHAMLIVFGSQGQSFVFGPSVDARRAVPST